MWRQYPRKRGMIFAMEMKILDNHFLSEDRSWRGSSDTMAGYVMPEVPGLPTAREANLQVLYASLLLPSGDHMEG